MKVRTKIVLTFVPLLVAVAAGAAIVQSVIAATTRRDRQIEASHEAVAAAHRLIKTALDAETGSRGFAITGNVEFLAPYEEATRTFDAAALELRESAPAHTDEVVRLFEEWRTLVEANVVAPRRADPRDPGPEAFIASGRGKRLTDQMRVVVDKIVQEEERRLDALRREQAQTRRLARLALLGFVLTVLICGAIGIAVATGVGRRAAKLGKAADDYASGVLTARSDVGGSDELGVLGARFNTMAARLEERTREATLLAQLGDTLHASLDLDEAMDLFRVHAPSLLAKDGEVLVVKASEDHLDAVLAWGAPSRSKPGARPEDCWALRRGQIHEHDPAKTASVACSHVTGARASMCVPLVAQHEALGVLRLELDPGTPTDMVRRVAAAAGTTLSLTIGNLRLRQTLRNQAIRDPLTGLFNRRYMEETLVRELSRAARAKQEVGVIMFDVDHFKRFNDTHGHAAGDAVLKALGAVARQHFRASDVVCRYGGEEFAVILPEASEAGVLERADGLRRAVQDLTVRVGDQTVGAVSISAGVAFFPRHGETGDALLEAADAALYRSKKDGRDRVTVAATT